MPFLQQALRSLSVLCALALLTLLSLPTLAWAEDPPESETWKRLKKGDADGDGRITRAEFSGPDRAWRRMDRDGDGVITQAEADGARAPGSGGARPGPREPARASGLPFATLDTDKDGVISASEWAAFMKRADENEDGSLQREEWDAAIGGGELRDSAPMVGDTAPKVSAKRRGLEARVDLGAIKRPTVLIFGSWT
ncbi:MAG: hypothetical protein O2894_12300 [Planctomycetota bacterium]|nr:hypothetical protein [Planctomycetota bacterium]